MKVASLSSVVFSNGHNCDNTVRWLRGCQKSLMEAPMYSCPAVPFAASDGAVLGRLPFGCIIHRNHKVVSLKGVFVHSCRCTNFTDDVIDCDGLVRLGLSA